MKAKPSTTKKSGFGRRFLLALLDASADQLEQEQNSKPTTADHIYWTDADGALRQGPAYDRIDSTIGTPLS